MNLRLYLTLAALTTVALGGCGGTTGKVGVPDSSTTSSSDAAGNADVVGDALPPTGADATSASSRDGGLPSDASGDALATCATDADLTMIAATDGAFADSGTDVPACLSCIRTTCQTELAACTENCACQVGVRTFVACISTSSDPTPCALQLVNQSPASLPLDQCIGGFALGGTGEGCLIACGFGGAGGGLGTVDASADE